MVFLDLQLKLWQKTYVESKIYFVKSFSLQYGTTRYRLVNIISFVSLDYTVIGVGQLVIRTVSQLRHLVSLVSVP